MVWGWGSASRWRGFVVAVSLVLLAATARAQVDVGAAERYALGPALQYAVDPDGDWTFAEARMADYRIAGVAVPNLGLGRKVVWLRVNLSADQADERLWYLVMRAILVDRATLYQPRADGSFAIQEAGVDLPRAGQLTRRHVAFALVPLLEEQTLWLRVEKTGSLRLPLSVETAQAYLADESLTYGLVGTLAGVLVALAVYLFATWLALREGTHLILSLLTVALTFYTIGSTGLVYESVPPDFIEQARIGVQLAVIAIYGLGALFVVGFLELRLAAPRLAWGLRGVAVFFAALAVVSVVQPIAVRLVLPVLGMAVLTGFLGVGLHAWFRHLPGARRFLIGWTPALVGGVIRQSLDVLALPANAVTVNLVYVGAALSALLFAITLSMRLRERDHAARRRLSDSEGRFRAYASAGSDWFWELDGDLRFVAVEGGPLAPRQLVGRLAADSAPAMAEVLRGHAAFRDVVVPYDTGDGAEGFLRVAGVPLHDAGGRFLGYRGAAADVTAARRAEQERRQQEKLATLGQLAGGVAHELNNLLHPIVNFAREAKGGLAAEDARNRRFLDLVTASGHQAGDIVRQILAFARRDGGRPAAADLVPALREALDVARQGRAVRTRFHAAVPRAVARVAPAELAQVVANLVANAVQARPDGVRVEVELSAAEGGWRIVVADDGPGIAADALPRVFDPFFTTKEMGHGTGLGLALVYNIVAQWGGRIAAENRAEGGARFVIDIPRADEGGT